MKQLLKFGAEWCTPCKQSDPLLNEITQFEVIRIDIDKEPEKVNEYNIRSVPTLIVLDENGDTLAYRTGGFNRNQLQEFLRQFLIP